MTVWLVGIVLFFQEIILATVFHRNQEADLLVWISNWEFLGYFGVSGEWVFEVLVLIEYPLMDLRSLTSMMVDFKWCVDTLTIKRPVMGSFLGGFVLPLLLLAGLFVCLFFFFFFGVALRSLLHLFVKVCSFSIFAVSTFFLCFV